MCPRWHPWCGVNYRQAYHPPRLTDYILVTRRARGPRTAPLSGAGGLDSHRQNGFIRGFGYCPLRGRAHVPPAAGIP